MFTQIPYKAVTTLEVKPGVYKQSEKKNVYIIANIWREKISVHTVIELAYKVFEYA